MGEIIHVTTRPVYFSGTQVHPVWSAIDVSGFGALDLTLGILNYTGTATGNIHIRVITCFEQDQDDTSWYPLDVNLPDPIVTMPFATFPYFTKATIRPPYARFLRWQVINWGDNSLTSMTFTIQGVARRNPPIRWP